MAEGPDPRDKPLEELEREITCAVCQGVYEQAKLLPCNHYYCCSCIEKMAAASSYRGEPLHCPECRKETVLPPGGVAALEPAFFVERMKDVYGKMAKAEGKVEAFCEQCSAAKSVAFCRQCAEFICEECARSHQKMKIFAGHVVASLEDLKKGGTNSFPLKEAPPAACADHGEPKKLFCFDCERLICRDCTIKEHRDHDFEFLTKCAPESRETLRDSLAPLQKVVIDMAAAEKSLVCEEAKVDRQKEVVTRSIQTSFDRLKALLDQRKTELVWRAGSLAQEKKDALGAQKRVLQAAQKEVGFLVEFVERNVEGTSDHDLMSIRRQLQTKMEEEEKRHRQLPLEPSATADITCKLPSPDVIPSNLGVVYSKSSPPGLFNITSCDLGSPGVVSLAAPMASPGDVSVSLVCVGDPSSSVEGEVVGNGVGVFNISLSPRVRGRHRLIVKVKDKEIEGSPFPIFVKLPPSQLGQGELHRIGGLTFPWGVAINSKKQLIVVPINYFGKEMVTVMNRDGRKIQTIDYNEFKDIRGVAVGSDGAVYVTDIGARHLFKFNSNGKLLKKVCGELESPFSVKIIDNQLYVVDYDSPLVNIFDTDLNVVGTIKTKECPKPRDVAQGPEGLLYVAGEGRISMYRCAPNGVFICHLNLSPSSLEFSEFIGICFDTTSGHIIASDCDNGVYVFKLSGECVHHISSDVIPHPAGVAVDEDGYVYVCGFIPNAVYIL